MSTGNKMRATFSQRGNEIRGTITLEGDGLFTLECLALMVDNLASKIDSTPDAVVRDLYSLVTGKVTVDATVNKIHNAR